MAFFPPDRPIPERLDAPSFSLRPLGEAAAALDYEAYTGSPDVIRAHSGGRWQVEGYTLEEERRELALHAERHRARQDFAFIMLAPDGARGLGCVYLLPIIPHIRRSAPPEVLAQVTEATAIVTFWVRQDRQQTALPAEVVAAVHGWLLAEWPFDGHLFRVNPAEHASIRALEQAGFGVRFELALEKPPHRYRFFGKPAS